MFTRYVYAIYPFDKDKHIAGVYVGSSYDVEERIKLHKCNHRNDSQAELHALMRVNGFDYEVLDTMNGSEESYKEYKWIEILSKRYPKVFNHYLGTGFPGKKYGIGNRIDKYLTQNNIFVYELAMTTGIKPLKLLKILSCRIDVDVIEYYKICKALQVPLNHFLEGVSA